MTPEGLCTKCSATQACAEHAIPMKAKHALRWSPARFGKTSAHCSCGTECPADAPEPIAQWFRLHQIEAMRGDFDEDEDDDDTPDEVIDILEGDDCGMDPRGYCGKAGSEECEFGCPYGRVKRN